MCPCQSLEDVRGASPVPGSEAAPVNWLRVKWPISSHPQLPGLLIENGLKPELIPSLPNTFDLENRPAAGNLGFQTYVIKHFWGK